MTATTKTKLAAFEKALRGATGTPTWDVRSTTTFPTFVGEVMQEEIVNKHGRYTTDETFRGGYLLEGYVEAGYKMTGWSKEDEGQFYVVFKQGIVKIVVEFHQYA